MQRSLQTKEENANFFTEESNLVTEGGKFKKSSTSFEDLQDSFTPLEETEPQKMDKITSDTDYLVLS